MLQLAFGSLQTPRLLCSVLCSLKQVKKGFANALNTNVPTENRTWCSRA